MRAGSAGLPAIGTGGNAQVFACWITAHAVRSTPTAAPSKHAHAVRRPTRHAVEDEIEPTLVGMR